MNATVRELLNIYQTRKTGWESGELNYGDSQYNSVCHLVNALQNQSQNDVVEFTKAENGNSILFKCNGIEIGRLPINKVEA